jgi:predicted RNase H-like HicB family nuclease
MENVNRFTISIAWNAEDDGYIATVPDLPGCSAWGISRRDALEEAQDAIVAWIMVPVYCAKCGRAFVFHGAPTPFCEKCR